MIDILYEEPLPSSIEAKYLNQFVTTIAKALKIKISTHFTINFVSTHYIQQLNKEFRGKDKPTDVLTFSLHEADDTFSSFENKKNLGDIAICLDEVIHNAQYFHTTMEEELQRVIIHGILHLLGKNHKTNDANEPMLIEQEAILQKFKKSLKNKKEKIP